MRKAAATARAGWSGQGSGAFQKAITQSPIYLSMVPASARMAPESGSSSRLTSAVSRSGQSFRRSDRLVKPRTSQNRTVRLRLSPPSLREAGLRASSRDEFRRNIARERLGDPAPQPALADEIEGEARAEHGEKGGGRQDRRRPEAAEAQKGPGTGNEPEGREERKPAARPGDFSTKERRKERRRDCETDRAETRHGEDEKPVPQIVEDRRLHLDAGGRLAARERVGRQESVGRTAVRARRRLQAQADEDDAVLEAFRAAGSGPDRGPGSRNRSGRCAAARSTGSARPGAGLAGAPAIRSASAAKPSAMPGRRRRYPSPSRSTEVTPDAAPVSVRAVDGSDAGRLDRPDRVVVSTSSAASSTSASQRGGEAPRRPPPSTGRRR